MSFSDWLSVFGVIGFIIFIGAIVLIPLICVIVLGTYLANVFHLTGLVWWAFVIVFYIIVMGIIGLVSKG